VVGGFGGFWRTWDLDLSVDMVEVEIEVQVARLALGEDEMPITHLNAIARVPN
jgi:hypothetical protein